MVVRFSPPHPLWAFYLKFPYIFHHCMLCTLGQYHKLIAKLLLLLFLPHSFRLMFALFSIPLFFSYHIRFVRRYFVLSLQFSRSDRSSRKEKLKCKLNVWYIESYAFDLSVNLPYSNEKKRSMAILLSSYILRLFLFWGCCCSFFTFHSLPLGQFGFWEQRTHWICVHFFNVDH